MLGTSPPPRRARQWPCQCPCQCPCRWPGRWSGRCPWLAVGRLGTVRRWHSAFPQQQQGQHCQMTQKAPACPRNHVTVFCGRLLTHCCSFTVIILSFAAMPLLLLLRIPRRRITWRHWHSAFVLLLLLIIIPGWRMIWGPWHSGLAGPMFCPAAGGGGPGACDGRGVSIGLIANLSVFSSLGGRR